MNLKNVLDFIEKTNVDAVIVAVFDKEKAESDDEWERETAIKDAFAAFNEGKLDFINAKYLNAEVCAISTDDEGTVRILVDLPKADSSGTSRY